MRNNKKNKWLKLKCILLLCVCAGMLAGCDIDTENAIIGEVNAGITKPDKQSQEVQTDTSSVEESVPETEVETEPEEVPQLSERQKQIKEYEAKYGTAEFAVTDYIALATLYGEESMVKKQRDMLEKCWRLYRDQGAFDMLRNITVNVVEEDAKIQNQVALMYQNLDLPEYRNEAVNMLCSDEWFKTMMPKLFEGRRNYYMNMANGGKIVVEVGYEAVDAPYSKVWYVDQMGNVVFLHKSAESVRMLSTGLSEGMYHGEYESWLCLADKGDIYHETGTFVRNVSVGDYTAEVYFGKKEVDLYSLWSNREGMKFTTYTGNFDRDGKTTLDQSESKKLTASRGDKGDKHVIYAYTSNESKCLFVSGTVEENVFGTEKFGISILPIYTTYEPAAKETPNVQIRVQDGNIEWFDGSIWQVIGAVEDFTAADPFNAYAVQEGFATEEEREDADAPDVYDNQGAGTLKKPSSGNTGSSSSGATTTPPSSGTTTPPSSGTTTPPSSGTTTPTPEPEPDTTPTPEPEPPASEDGDDMWTGDIL